MKKGMIILIVSAVIVVAIVSAIIIFSSVPTTLTCSGANPNECNGQCWSNCTVYQIFKCESSGGMLCSKPK